MFDLQGYENLILGGLWVTVQLAVSALGCGIVLGLIFAGGQMARYGWIRGPVTALTNGLRGIPELLVIFLIYYGSEDVIAAVTGQRIEIGKFGAGVAALAIIFASYAAEVFRGAFQAIPYGQIEAGRAFGMSSWLILRRIQLPQMWRFALPGLGNLWLVLTKDTSLVSVIGLADLVRQTQVAVGNTKEPFLFFGLLSLIYLAITILSTLAMKRLEARAQIGVAPMKG